MSAQAKPSVTECHGPCCNKVDRTWRFAHGKFCSNECEARRKGCKALSSLKYSHTRCFSCLSILKDIEPPKPDWAFQEVTSGWTFNPTEDRIEMLACDQDETRQSACGFQSLTPDAVVDEKNVHKKTVTGAVCGQCGATDHTTHIALLADGHRTVARVAAFLTDEDDRDFDSETLYRRYRATGDIELAAGAAILARR